MTMQVEMGAGGVSPSGARPAGPESMTSATRLASSCTGVDPQMAAKSGADFGASSRLADSVLTAKDQPSTSPSAGTEVPGPCVAKAQASAPTGACQYVQ